MFNFIDFSYKINHYIQIAIHINIIYMFIYFIY